MKSTKFAIYSLLLAGGLSLFSSCSKDDQTFEFPVTYTTDSFGPLTSFNSVYLTEPVGAPLEAFVTSKGGSLDRLKKVELKEATITSSGDDFNGISNADVWLKDGSDSVKLAYKVAFPQNSKTVVLDKSAFDDVAKYLKSTTSVVTFNEYNAAAVSGPKTATIKATFTITLSGE